MISHHVLIRGMFLLAGFFNPSHLNVATKVTIKVPHQVKPSKNALTKIGNRVFNTTVFFRMTSSILKSSMSMPWIEEV